MHAFQVDGAIGHFWLTYLNYNLIKLMLRQLRRDRIRNHGRREASGFSWCFSFFWRTAQPAGEDI